MTPSLYDVLVFTAIVGVITFILMKILIWLVTRKK
jgi:hypothetical protein